MTLLVDIKYQYFIDNFLDILSYSSDCDTEYEKVK